MIGEAILSVQQLVKAYGAQPILEGVSLTVHEGDRIGLIGRNGTGKSTLMKILAGTETPDGGIVTRKQGLRVAMLRQECSLDRSLTVDATLKAAADEIRALIDAYHGAYAALAEAPHSGPEHDALAAQVETLQHEIEIADAWNLEQDIKQAAVALALPPGDRVLSQLSGGELRRVDIAATVLRRPDVLLLDEPTNHIDVQSVEWIETFLAGYAGSCVVITHDRYFLERVANRIVELEFGSLISNSGNYEKFLEYKAARAEFEVKNESNRLSLLRRELEWLRRGPKARGTKQKARIARIHAWAEQGPPQQHKDIEFIIPEPPRLGKTILECDNLTKSYDGKRLFTDFHIIMQKNMTVGIVGPNGSGKSTLLRVLMGKEKPDAGRVVIGDLTDFVWIDQVHGDMDPEDSVLQYVSDGLREIEVAGRKVFVPGFLERFLFDQSVAQMKLKYLSGGEKNKIDLCKKLIRGGNFLIFDEPTNDLDLPTLRVLEEAIAEFEGCAIVVSHDRYFLNRVCTHTVVFEGDGRQTIITGNYDDYLLYRKRTDQEAAAASQRAAKSAVSAPASKPDRAKKLSYNEKKELERIEAAIETAESRVRELEMQAAAPAFYQQAPADIQAGLAALTAARAEVDALYARWQELEALA